MNQNIYKNYTDTIRTTLINGQKRGQAANEVINKGFHNFTGLSGIQNSATTEFSNESADESLYKSLQPLSDITGKKAKYSEVPGRHPDFLHIKQSNTVENHYITSMFIDINNSTGLFRKYDPIAVANITTTIQRAAIHTCWYFDGFIQRFHGDGLFAYFGGKSMTMQQSIANAINAGSFFSYFIQNDLKNLFQELGVENIYTRIGIDTGKAEDVLWHLAGMKDCSEVTTCSLHTSLASKMQGNAKSNGIMLGDNVKDNSSVHTEMFNIKYNQKDGKEERYIFQIPEENFNYTQWEFNWEKYLRKHPAIIADEAGNLFFKPKDTPSVTRSLNTEFLKSAAHGYKPYFK